MTDLRKAAEQALEALETYWMGENAGKDGFNAIQALRQALATEEALDRMVAENQRLGLYDEDLQPAIEKGTKAWADVPDATECVDDLRGTDLKSPVKTYSGGKPNYCTMPETLTLDRGCYERGCVAYDERDGDGVTISAKREWVGLTHEETMEGLSSFNEYGNLDGFSFAQWVEAKLKEKNGG